MTTDQSGTGMRLLPFILLSIILTLSLAELGSGAKILSISFFSSKSHKITYQRLLEELGRRGHQITIVSPIPSSGKGSPNVKEILTFDVEKAMLDNPKFKFNVFEMKEAGQKVNPFMFGDLFKDICETSYDLPQVKALMQEEFDLIFFQPFMNDCVLGLVHSLNAPVVLFSPISAMNTLVSKLGGYHPPSFVSNVFLGYGDEMNFFQRFLNVGMNAFFDVIINFYYNPQMEALYRAKLGQNLPGINEILANSSLILSNGHFSLARPRPNLPNIIDVGGIHSRKAEKLPKDLESFINEGKDGFILFSMGSAIKGEMMSEQKRKIFVNVFSKLKQRVLWKWESETMPDLPKNVKLSKWLPQQDLLGHEKIRMFITHCGGGSTEEAIYHGVPLLGMPMFGDQELNSRQAESHGFLHQLDWNKLTEEDLMAGIQEILQNPKYKENVQRLSRVFSDQPDDPLTRGVYWIEYVIRHKGAPQLRSAARDLNFFQYHCLDVIGAYFLIISLILYIIFATTRWVFRKVCRCFGGGKGKEEGMKKKKNN